MIFQWPEAVNSSVDQMHIDAAACRTNATHTGDRLSLAVGAPGSDSRSRRRFYKRLISSIHSRSDLLTCAWYRDLFYAERSILTIGSSTPNCFAEKQFARSVADIHPMGYLRNKKPPTSKSQSRRTWMRARRISCRRDEVGPVDATRRTANGINGRARNVDRAHEARGCPGSSILAPRFRQSR